MSDGSGTTSWTYDAGGRITTEQRTIEGITKTIGYAWNGDGSLLSITYPGGRAVQYSTNNAERPTAARDTAKPTVFYDATALYETYGAFRGAYNGVTSEWAGVHYTQSYNNRVQLNGISAGSTNGTAENIGINYNGVGNNGTIASITNNVTAGLGENFTYDALDRALTGATQSSTVNGCWGEGFGTGHAAEDRWGNLTQIGVTQCMGGSLSVAAPSSTNQITWSGFAVSAAGNMTQDGTGNSYTFDAENRITEASLGSGGNWYYVYDGNGLRVAKCQNPAIAPCNGAARTLYFRDTFGNLLEETDQDGNLIEDYIYFGGRKAAQEDAYGNILYLYPDQVGSTVAMTNSSGTPCYAATFTPYGEEHSTMDSCQSGGTSTNLKFTGYERDTETGLDYAFARYYSYRLGRFMSADPLGGSITNPQTLNRYAYVANNPVSYSDPSGLFKCSINLSWSATITGGLAGHCSPGWDNGYGSSILGGEDEYGVYGLYGSSGGGAGFAGQDAYSGLFDGGGTGLALLFDPSLWVQAPLTYIFVTDYEGDLNSPDNFQDFLFSGGGPGGGGSAANCIMNALNKQFNLNFAFTSSNGSNGGHENDTFSASLDGAQAASLSAQLPPGGNGVPPGWRYEGGLHISAQPGFSGGIITVTAHVDAFDPNDGALSALGHALYDFLGGHIAQLFGGTLDHKCNY